MLELALLSAWAICMIGGSAVLHECGHAWTARSVGWNVIGLRYRWYGVAVVAESNGRTDQLWKVAAGGLVATALLWFGSSNRVAFRSRAGLAAIRILLGRPQVTSDLVEKFDGGHRSLLLRK